MELTARINYIKEPVTREGRAGEYAMQGVRLNWQNEKGQYQSAFGQFFGDNAKLFQQLNARPGDKITVDLLFSVSERNGYVSTLLEFVAPQLAAPDAPEGLTPRQS